MDSQLKTISTTPSSMIVNDVNDDQSKKVNGSAEENLDHSKKVYVIKEIGHPPEDPVCESGIFCYGKTSFKFDNVT
jgi:hypothetical protein